MPFQRCNPTKTCLLCRVLSLPLDRWAGRREARQPTAGLRSLLAAAGWLRDRLLASSRLSGFAAKDLERALIFQLKCFFGFSHEESFEAVRCWLLTREQFGCCCVGGGGEIAHVPACPVFWSSWELHGYPHGFVLVSDEGCELASTT